MECIICSGPRPSKTIPVCQRCAKTSGWVAKEIHEGLDAIGGNKCSLCSNRCGTDEGLCGVRGRVSSETALLHAYLDPLPTNCCNSWFCNGSRLEGYNLAVFYYGCNFDCLYCQNWEHRHVERAPAVKLEDAVKAALDPRVRCVCHFGGSPEPQMPFALRFSEEVLERKPDTMICWEWNGDGSRRLAMRAGEISSLSKGTVKFDLKAWSEDLHLILTGRSNRNVLKNFEALAERYPEVISATTLLVPYYVDAEEVEGIAKLIASINDEIPYSLLVSHPDYRLSDLPVTPREQVLECLRAAKRHLKNVHLGNRHLLGW
ncbi:radical SAM protein [Geoglobus ahangari]